MPWLRMAWLWSWCFVASSLPLSLLLRSVRYQNAAGGDERCRTARSQCSGADVPGLQLDSSQVAPVVIGTTVMCATAAVRCRAQLRQNQGLELQFRLRYLCLFRLRRLVGHSPLFEIAMRQCFNCSIFGEFESAQAADSICSLPPCAGGERSERAAPLCINHKVFAANSKPRRRRSTRRNLPLFGHRDQAFALGLFPGRLARTPDGFRLLAGLALGGFFIRLAALHLAKEALVLHLLL